MSDLCLGVEKVFKEIMHFQCMISVYVLYGHILAQEPLPRGHESYNFGRPFFCHHYYIHSLSEPCPWVEKKIFKEIHQFYTFYPQITTPWGGGSWNLQFLVSLQYRCYILNLIKIGPVVLEKMLTHDGWWTTTDTNQ